MANKRTNKQKKGMVTALGALLLLMILPKRGNAKSTLFIDDRYSDYSLATSTLKSYAKRNLNQIEQIVVHHSGTQGQTAEDYARYHVNTKDWPGIGYHFVIERDGLVVMGNPLENISYHVSGQNTKSIGIALSGNFEVENPTAAQLDSLGKLIELLRTKLPQNLQVFGHKDFGTTSCPGGSLYNFIQTYKLA